MNERSPALKAGATPSNSGLDVKRLTYLTAGLLTVAALAGGGWVVEAVAIYRYQTDMASAVEPPPTGEESQEDPAALLTALDPHIVDARRIQTICLLLGGFAAAGAVYCIWWRRT